ncbi:MAG TPA: YihY/virulence factor BrkB family protein, partial [Candidatus Caenarcaniphilales bacterium]
NILRQRFLSFTMVLVIGFLLLVSLLLSAALAALGNFMSGLLPGLEVILHLANLIISYSVVTVLFAMIYKFLPDAKIAWGDVWLGAAITTLLFEIGRYLIGLYLGNASFGSTYGAAGSLVILLAWVYFSAQILFLGAEFTQVYASKFGSRIVPAKNAVPLTAEARAKQGIPRTEDVEAAAQAQEPTAKSSQTGLRAQSASHSRSAASQTQRRSGVLGLITNLGRRFTGSPRRRRNRR